MILYLKILFHNISFDQTFTMLYSIYSEELYQYHLKSGQLADRLLLKCVMHYQISPGNILCQVGELLKSLKGGLRLWKTAKDNPLLALELDSSP